MYKKYSNTPYYKKCEKLRKAIRDKGYYGSNGIWNAIIVFTNDEHIYRHRVETLIINDKDEIFVKVGINGKYSLPCGSVEKNIPHIMQAYNECKEEARILVKDLEYTGIDYKEILHDLPKWIQYQNDINWNGKYTEIFIGKYDKKYDGFIRKEDRDHNIITGEFLSFKECFKFFRKEHREAIYWYVKNRDKGE